MRNSFVMHDAVMTLIRSMDAENRAMLILAIAEYVQDGHTNTDLSAYPVAKCTFDLFCKDFAEDSKKYDETIRARSEAGKSSGRRRANSQKSDINSASVPFDEQKGTNLTNVNFVEQTSTNATSVNNSEQSETKRTDYVNDYVYDYVYDYDSDNDCVNDSENEEEKTFSLVSNETNCQTQSVQHVVDEWNTLTDVGINPIAKLSNGSKRYKCLTARLREYGEEDVLKAVDRIRKSDFLQGRHTGKPWQITFDWFVLPNNFPKVLEGNYDNDVGHSFGGYGKSSGKVDWDAV